jgi:hypothetical protein
LWLQSYPIKSLPPVQFLSGQTVPLTGYRIKKMLEYCELKISPQAIAGNEISFNSLGRISIVLSEITVVSGSMA